MLDREKFVINECIEPSEGIRITNVTFTGSAEYRMAIIDMASGNYNVAEVHIANISDLNDLAEVFNYVGLSNPNFMLCTRFNSLFDLHSPANISEITSDFLPYFIIEQSETPKCLFMDPVKHQYNDNMIRFVKDEDGSNFSMYVEDFEPGFEVLEPGIEDFEPGDQFAITMFKLYEHFSK